jgi:hypothetical protein
VDGLLAGCVDALDGGCGFFVGVGFGDGLELGEGEGMDLADDWWGEGGVEEGFEDRLGEGRGRGRSRRYAEVAEISRRRGEGG